MSADNVRAQIEELERLKQRTRRLSLLTLLGLTAMVVAGVGSIFIALHSLTVAGPRQSEFLRHLGANLQTQVLPVAQKMAEPSLKRLKPVVEAELGQLDAQAPRLSEAALRELSRLGPNLVQQAETTLDQTLKQTLALRERKLRTIFPAASDKNIATLMENLRRESRERITRTADHVFLPHLSSIHRILANLEKIQQTEPVTANREVTSWQMAFLFVDVFTEEFKDLRLGGPSPAR
jgi:hypothetical protein